MENSFFRQSRKLIVDQIEDGAVVVLGAYQKMQISGDAVAAFQQEGNFWYTTGIEESDWRLIFTHQKTWLVRPAISETEQIFEGSLSDSDAQKVSGADEVIDVSAASQLLDQLSAQGVELYTLKAHPHESSFGFAINPAPGQLVTELTGKFQKVKDIRPIISRLRAIKRPEEIGAIERAVEITIAAFNEARNILPVARYEYEVEAAMTAAIRRVDAIHAYEPIVAAGLNACTLHYGKNNTQLNPGELLLIDVGARKNGYAADITRTYGVGAIKSRQQTLHNRLAEAHRDIIELLRPGVSFTEYQKMSDEIMKDFLGSVGLLHRESDYRRYFPHAVTHGLGIDVHDSLGGYTRIEAGMVLTVEPGVYIPEEKTGVRLEDTIIITDEGSRNLSEGLGLGV